MECCSYTNSVVLKIRSHFHFVLRDGTMKHNRKTLIVKSIPGLIVAVLVYGFFLRPMLSVEDLRDETFVLQPGQIKTFDMNLSGTNKRVLNLKYEVVSGNPINLTVATMESTQRGSNGVVEVDAFQSASVTSGEKEALLPPGLWSVLVGSPPNVSGSTKIKIKTQLHRPRWFQKVASPAQR